MSTQVLKSLSFITMSAPSTPGTGLGTMYASASSIYFKNTNGTVYDLAASNGRINIRYYTGSTTTQTYEWSAPSNLKYLEVICIGGGGGGGGGSTTVNVTQVGGLGGGGGAVTWCTIPSPFLTNSPYTISVGKGGTGATAGNTGQIGEPTSFGNLPLVLATPGSGGQAGNSAGGAIPGRRATYGGSALNCIPIATSLNGCGGGASGQVLRSGSIQPPQLIFGAGTSNVADYVIVEWGNGGGGGGSGMCVSASFTIPSNNGSSGYQNGVFTPNSGIGGTSGVNGSNGTNNLITTLIKSQEITTLHGLGGGGGGGGLSANGGNGGNYGAGGGGGGAKLNSPTPAGNGGNGSPGLCILVEYY